MKKNLKMLAIMTAGMLLNITEVHAKNIENEIVDMDSDIDINLSENIDYKAIHAKLATTYEELFFIDFQNKEYKDVLKVKLLCEVSGKNTEIQLPVENLEKTLAEKGISKYDSLNIKEIKPIVAEGSINNYGLNKGLNLKISFNILETMNENYKNIKVQ